MSELFKLKNGTVLISTEAPGGIYNSAQLKKIAELCSKELAIVKATEDQRLSLFVKESEVERVTQELKTTGLGFRNYQSGLHQPVSCLGELCETHDQPALTTAMDLTKLLADLKLQSPLKIGINGCARCCTPCHTLDVSVIGEPSGYRISLGGKPSQFPELASFFAESVPAEKLPKLLTNVIEIFQSKAEPGESLNEVLDRCGVEDFITALAPYSQDAAHRDDPFAVPEVSTESHETTEDFGEIGGDSMEMELEVEPNLESENEPANLESSSTDEMMELEFEETAVDEAEEMDYDLSSHNGSEGDSLEEVRINADQHGALDDDIVLGESEMIDDSDILLDSMEEVPELESAAPPSGEMDEVLDDISDTPEILPPSLLEDEDGMEMGATNDADSMDEVLDDIDTTPEIVPPSLLDDGDVELDAVNAGDVDDLDGAMLSEDDGAGIDTEEAQIKADLKADSELHLSEEPEQEMIELEFEDSELMIEAAALEVISSDESDSIESPDEDLSFEEPEMLEIEESLELSADDEGNLEADVPQLSDETSELPELDEDLLLTDDLEVSAEVSADLDDGESEGELMSSEDENDFEEKIQASIEEEKKMRQHIEEDTNRSAREDTLRMLETASAQSASPAAYSSAPKAFPAKGNANSKASKSFELEGVDVTDGIMRVYFSSGAYIDFNLETLHDSQSKVLRMGKQAITVTHEGDGYTLEVDGMKMFYPKENLRAAS